MYTTRICGYCGKNINIKYNLCPLCGERKEFVRKVPHFRNFRRWLFGG